MNNEEIAIELCKKFNLQFIGLKVINYRPYIEFICNIHKDKGIQCKRFDHFKKSKNGCPYCYGLYQTTEDLINNPKLREEVIVLGEFKKDNIKIECRCKICGHEWMVAQTS